MEKKDSRMFERFAVELAAEIRQPGALESNNARCCNIGAGGVCLLADQSPVTNTMLEVLLGMPNGRAPFQGLAKVVWSRQAQEGKWYLGLEFDKVDFMSLRRIFGPESHRP